MLFRLNTNEVKLIKCTCSYYEVLGENNLIIKIKFYTEEKSYTLEYSTISKQDDLRYSKSQVFKMKTKYITELINFLIGLKSDSYDHIRKMLIIVIEDIKSL